MALSNNPAAERSQTFFRLFAYYTEWLLSREFHAVRAIIHDDLYTLKNHPVVCYTNHASWWDPLVFIHLSRNLFADRKAFGPMDARSLENFSFMKKLGIFGIEPDTAHGARTFLQTATELLKSPESLLWVTAEGRFTDPREPLVIRPGVAHLVKRAPQISLIPVAFEYPFWEERYPELLIQIGRPIPAESLGQRNLDQILDFQTRALRQTMRNLARRSLQRDPLAFTTLIHGNSGANPVYDGLSRLSAKIRKCGAPPLDRKTSDD